MCGKGCPSHWLGKSQNNWFGAASLTCQKTRTMKPLMCHTRINQLTSDIRTCPPPPSTLLAFGPLQLCHWWPLGRTQYCGINSLCSHSAMILRRPFSGTSTTNDDTNTPCQASGPQHTTSPPRGVPYILRMGVAHSRLTPDIPSNPVVHKPQRCFRYPCHFRMYMPLTCSDYVCTFRFGPKP